MKRIFLSTALVAMLAGCDTKLDNSIKPGDYTKHDFIVLCLDGTEYWIRKGGHAGYMSPKIDRETRQPATCEVES